MKHSADASRAPAVMEPLSVDECLEKLSSGTLGRIAFVVNGEPMILPVNYVLHEGAVVFRTTYGTTLDTISQGARVAFEVDGLDAEQRTGWSVVVRGKGEEIWLPDELEDARQLPVSSWAPGERSHFVQILPSAMTGRRITRSGEDPR